MINFSIDKVIMDMFKGVRHAEYEFGNVTHITGRNGSCKTTVFDAILWLMADKDYALHSNPEVHPTFAAESEPSVTIIGKLESDTGDVQTVTLRKFQKDKRTKKQKEEGAPVRISNEYEINAVPKNQKDFFAYLEEAGIEIDKFLLLTHPEIFTGQKSADCRKVLFGMASDITDKEIAGALGCEELSALLESYKPDEILAMKRREVKEADAQLDSIPEQIIGMEQSKVEVNEAEFKAQRETLKAEAAELEEKVMELRKLDVGALNQELARLDQEGKTILANANSERVAKLTELNAIIGNMRIQYKQLEAKKERLTANLDDFLKIKKDLEKRYNDLSQKYQDAKNSEFHAETKCQYCGQDLPISQIDDLRKRFEKNKERIKADLNERAAAIVKMNKTNDANTIECQKALQETEKQLTAMAAEIEQKCKEREPLECVIDATGSKEYSDVLSKIAEVHHKLNKYDEAKAQEDYLMAQLRDHNEAIRDIDDHLAQAKVNERIDQKIAEAKQRQKEYSQARANAMKILDQMSQVSMKKNEMLTDQVNSHFHRVKFRLFVTQKNGEVRDDCTPLVLTKDGEYRDMTYSANTAAIVLAQLDIIAGLQEFYGQHLPVLLDGAECLDSHSMSEIKLPTQLITLSVSDGELELRSA